MRKFTSLLCVITSLFLFSNQSSASTEVDEIAENISQYINEADVNRESQINKETVSKKAMKSKTQNKTIHSAMRDHKRLSVNRNAGWLQASSQMLNVSIPDTKNRAVWLSRANAKKGENSFIVGLPNTGGTSQTKVTSDGSVVYVDDQHSTDVAVQPFDDSTRVLTILNGADSPTEYSYSVSLPVGGKIVKSEDGGILVFSKDGSLIGGFAAPWAVDADGKKIPTHYDIRDNSVVQVVEHLGNNTHYPVVADPWLWKDLIYSWSWTRDSIGNRLLVYPTTWARMQLSGYYVGVAGWNELYSKNPRGSYSGQNLSVSTNSMKNQYICHQMTLLPAFKSSWNLEQYRPDVGLTRTIASACNPN